MYKTLSSSSLFLLPMAADEVSFQEPCAHIHRRRLCLRRRRRISQKSCWLGKYEWPRQAGRQAGRQSLSLERKRAARRNRDLPPWDNLAPSSLQFIFLQWRTRSSLLLSLFFLRHAHMLRGREKGYGGGFGGLMRKTEHIVPISSQMEWPLGTAPFPSPSPSPFSVFHSAIFPSLFSLCRVPGRLFPFPLPLASTSPSNPHCILLAQ